MHSWAKRALLLFICCAPLAGLISPAQAGACCSATFLEGCPEAFFCEECVCFVDEYCCTDAWDGLCVNIANTSCPVKCGCGPSKLCGDGVCAVSESKVSCPADCGCPISTQIVDCDGECKAVGPYQNGFCNAGATSSMPNFNCAELDYDGGDCCPLDMEKGCDGLTCYPSAWKGDGFCDLEYICEEKAWDDGDCPLGYVCEADEVSGCFGGCFSSSFLGDGFCDPGLNCSTHFDDYGDCAGLDCAEGEILDCDVECRSTACKGDGMCHDGTIYCDLEGGYPNFHCESLAYDSGDCCPWDWVNGCDGGGCYSLDWVGDDFCDDVLDCEAFDFDGGDCEDVFVCGDEYCSSVEDCESCALDCGACTPICSEPLGDVTGDLDVDLLDIQCVIVTKFTKEGESPVCVADSWMDADLNCDMIINILDIVISVNVVLGLTTTCSSGCL